MSNTSWRRWWGQKSDDGSGGASSYSAQGSTSSELLDIINMFSDEGISSTPEVVSTSSHGSGLEAADERIYYADPDFVTTSQEAFSNSTSRQKSKKGEFDLERWWVTSSLWRRMIPFLLFLFFIVTLFQLIFALYCFGLIGTEWDAVPDPYTCATPSCVDTANTLRESINPKADPCTNFYEYGCGSYINDDEDPDSIPTTVRHTHAYQSFSASQEAQMSELLRLRGDKTDKIVDFYKGCIDERSRLEVGIDPLLIHFRQMLPSAFGDLSSRTQADLAKETVEFGRLFGEYAAFRFFYLPDHKIAFARPQWVLFYGHIFKRLLATPQSRAAYQADLASFFTKLWDRMEELELIDQPPYSAQAAAEYIVIMANAVLNYVYDPAQPLPAYTPADLAVSRAYYAKVMSSTLGQEYGVVNSEIPLEKYAFGDWAGTGSGQVGSLLVLFAVNGPLYHDLTSKRNPPVLPNQFNPQLYNAIHAFYIFLYFNAYTGEIRPKTWVQNDLDKIFPGRFTQDLMGFLKIESFCMSSMVYYMNTFTMLRLYKIIPERLNNDHLDKLRTKVEELRVETIWSLRRWYTRRGRAGQLDPRMHFITRNFFSASNPIFLDFPLPEFTKKQKSILDRQASYLDEWEIDTDNYLGSTSSARILIRAGKLKDWQNNALTDGENDQIYLDFVLTSTFTTEFTEYRSSIDLPLLLIEPPYFLNDVPVLDYSGTALFVARALLQIWVSSIRDPGALKFPAGVVEGISTSSGHWTEEECSAIPVRDPSIGLEKTSFAKFVTSGNGLAALAMKAAFDIYKHPEQFQALIDVRTGEATQRRVESDGSFVFIAPEFYSNGTVEHFNVRRYANGTLAKTPVDRKRFVSPVELRQYKLVYKRLKTLEQYNLDQLFFLWSINTLCYSAHGRGNPRFDRYVQLLNGVFQQLIEFGETWNCSLSSPMNPKDSCFVHQEE